MNYGPEDVVKISAPATKQNPRSQGVVPPPKHPPGEKREALQPLNHFAQSLPIPIFYKPPLYKNFEKHPPNFIQPLQV